MLLNTLITVITVVVRGVLTLVCLTRTLEFDAARVKSNRFDSMTWMTVKTTRFRWEAELIQQVLIAHEISVRIIDLGIESYMGQGSPMSEATEAFE